MPAYEADREKFAGYDAQVVGISMDSVFSHVAWQRHQIGIVNYPLASDFFPHGETARKYGVFRETDPLPGISERAIFVIDKQGEIVFAKVYPLSLSPPNEEVFAVLEKLK
jgi:alkyl hydroperoxide reductase subunit AhpC